MSKEKFIYNKQTLQYEPVKLSRNDVFLRIFGILSGLIVLFVFVQFTFGKYFPSPALVRSQLEVNQLEGELSEMHSTLDQMSLVLDNVKERDNSVHRQVFGMEPIDTDIWNSGIGGHDVSDHITDYGGSTEMLKATVTKLDKLSRQLTIQSRSLDTLENLSADKEKMLASIPSIKPVRKDKLPRNMKLLSGFGMRMHPVHKIRKKHTGIDFTASTGTPIQSTGDGVVIRVQNNKRGYGKNVIIDHGYGYTTLYGHMATMDVKKGQKVTKGQLIGTVGSTGTSTAPHLHYEVRYKKNPVNPIDYCTDGLTAQEYQDLVNQSSVMNQSLD